MHQSEEQLEQFFNVILNKHVDGIIFSALSKKNIELVEKECIKRNIPLMTLDMIYRSNHLCHIGPDYYQLGTFSAAYLSQLINHTGKVLTITYDEGYEIGAERMRGFFDKLTTFSNIEVLNIDINQINKDKYWYILDKYLNEYKPNAIYSPYHVEYIAEDLEVHGVRNSKYKLIANGVNDSIEKYLFNGIIDGIVSARPYYLGAVIANNFFKYFYRNSESVKGEIDVLVDIYIAENYVRHNKLF